MRDGSHPLNQVTERVIGAAIEVHRAIGPGLLESAYEECMAQEMTIRRLRFRRQERLPISYRSVRLVWRLPDRLSRQRRGGRRAEGWMQSDRSTERSS